MSNLFANAVTAHGGLDRWNQVKSITVAASITGAVWFVEKPGDALEHIRFEVDTTRQRLAMDFVGPDQIKSPTREQISCFGPDGLLRRHDCNIDVVAGAPSMPYATDYSDLDGIVIPTTRRGYAWQGDYELVPEPLLVAINMGEITIR
jgi:hypothetical protein